MFLARRVTKIFLSPKKSFGSAERSIPIRNAKRGFDHALAFDLGFGGVAFGGSQKATPTFLSIKKNLIDSS